jgi:hypothetical protein
MGCCHRGLSVEIHQRRGGHGPQPPDRNGVPRAGVQPQRPVRQVAARRPGTARWWQPRASARRGRPPPRHTSAAVVVGGRGRRQGGLQDGTRPGGCRALREGCTQGPARREEAGGRRPSGEQGSQRHPLGGGEGGEGRGGGPPRRQAAGSLQSEVARGRGGGAPKEVPERGPCARGAPCKGVSRGSEGCGAALRARPILALLFQGVLGAMGTGARPRAAGAERGAPLVPAARRGRSGRPCHAEPSYGLQRPHACDSRPCFRGSQIRSNQISSHRGKKRHNGSDDNGDDGPALISQAGGAARRSRRRSTPGAPQAMLEIKVWKETTD